MRRHEPCAHLRPDYDRLEVAHHITRNPDTYEISWPPCSIEDELIRFGLITKKNAQVIDINTTATIKNGECK